MLYFHVLGANSSVERKPHDTFLACSKAFRNLSRKPICPLKIESCFKIIFAIKRMDKRCWYRKHKVINHMIQDHSYRGGLLSWFNPSQQLSTTQLLPPVSQPKPGHLWIRSNCGIKLSTYGLIVSIQQKLPKQLNSPCLPQPARGRGSYHWTGWVLGRT